MQQLLIMGRSIRLLEGYSSLADTHDIWFSYGSHVPILKNDFLFSGAGRYALALKQFMPERSFMSPGSRWLSHVPHEFLEREVHAESFTKLVENAPEETIWFKLAEMKHDAIKPGVYELATLANILTEEPALGSVNIQWTTSIIPMNREHRFFILDGEPVSGSPYLVDGVLYGSKISWNFYEEAEKFAKKVAKTLADFSPQAYVLDVAFNEQSGNWIVVEANRVWSAGLYGADPRRVISALRASLTASPWEWIPDPIVYKYLEALTEVKSESTISGLLHFSK